MRRDLHVRNMQGRAGSAMCALAIELVLGLTLVSGICALVATRNAVSGGMSGGDEAGLASASGARMADAPGPGSSARGDVLERLHAARSRALEREILRIAREAAAEAVGQRVAQPARHEGGSEHALASPAGVFVTLIVDGEVRGCMGTVYPMEARLCDEIAGAARMAARSDPRRPPLAAEELPETELCVSVVGRVRRVPLDYVADPRREGVIVRSRDGSGVILPGEARTFAYELASAKREAGVGPGETFELYVFETERFGRALPLRR